MLKQCVLHCLSYKDTQVPVFYVLLLLFDIVNKSVCVIMYVIEKTC